MNRLIIIGNGFDLAHGLKTSCKDFISDYLFNIWLNFPNDNYEDRLITAHNTKEYFENHKDKYNIDSIITLFSNLSQNRLSGNRPRITINSNFFKAIFNKLVNLNWADVESEFFNELYHIVESRNFRKQNTRDRISLETSKYTKIKKLNQDLEYLQSLLVKYLKSQEKEYYKLSRHDNLYTEYFNEPVVKHRDISILDPEKILFLNFNYTNILSVYNIKSNIINIHGSLIDSPIFGFGDDTSSEYKTLENENNNEILKNFKSFKYLDNNKYKSLVNFIDLKGFSVYIFGHSCGISDRTLFKQIFENEHCRDIRVFHHNQIDFEEKKFEISRHFDDKTTFLNKVSSFDKLRTMPQPINN